MELSLAYTHGREEIRTLKGISRSVSNRDRLSLACALPLISRLLPLFTCEQVNHRFLGTNMRGQMDSNHRQSD